MRDRLITILLEPARPVRPSEDFFLAGPSASARKEPDRVQHATLLATLLAKIRRQPRRVDDPHGA